MQYSQTASMADPTRGKKGVHSLDHLETHGLCNGLTVFNPSQAQIGALMDRARADLPDIAANEVVQRVARSNPDSFWGIRRALGSSEAEPRGFATFLMLNERGVDALITGTLDATDPPAEFLVGQHQKPAAIYVWLVYAKGRLAPALGLVMEKLQTPLYRDVDLIARAVTTEGNQFNDSLGFQRGLWWDGKFHPRIHHYRRKAVPRGQALIDIRAPYDDFGSAAAGPITVKVVHTLDELMKAHAVRAAVFMGEQDCPYAEEFDGNDCSGTHMLAFDGNEPVGCLRIRYFADFAKIERVAVLPNARMKGAGRKLVQAAMEFCQVKGYRQLIAHARIELNGFWSKLGFDPLPDGVQFEFSGLQFVELSCAIMPAAEALNAATDPYILIRPEGRWDRPGILEHSLLRARGPIAIAAAA